MNWPLKQRIINAFGYQWKFAQTINTRECIVSKVVRGQRNLGPKQQAKWAEALGCSLEEVFQSMPEDIKPINPLLDAREVQNILRCSLACASHRYSHACGSATCVSPLSSRRQVPTFRTKAWIKFMPSLIFRHLINGSLVLISLTHT